MRQSRNLKVAPRRVILRVALSASTQKGSGMSNDDIAAAVLECVGGLDNVAGNSLCATRLRISLNDQSLADHNALHSINGVLGIAERGGSGIEVVFGPNMVRGVFQAFSRLTGPMAHKETEEPPTRAAGNFRVKITPETPGRPQVQTVVATPSVTPTPVEDNVTNALLERLDEGEEASDDLAPLLDLELGSRLLVINGPNINLLGTLDVSLYGDDDYDALLALCHQSAREAGFADCECYQSNHEGDLIDCIQDAFDRFDAIAINPGAYAYTSIALLDALEAVQLPAIEVRLCDQSTREDFRQRSFVRMGCIDGIQGHGIQGYREAIFELARHLGILEDR